MTQKERLLHVLSGDAVERPPVVVPGGLVTALSEEVIEATRPDGWSLVHCADGLASLSIHIHDTTGIENLGLPFTMRVESEAYGGEKDTFPSNEEPSSVGYPLRDVSEYRNLKVPDPGSDGRLPLVIDCIGILSRRRPAAPVVADLVAPLSLATSLVDAHTVLRALVREPLRMHGLLSFLSEGTVEYMRRLIGAGASAIFLVDPFSTAQTLGPQLFREFALPYINTITDAAHEMGCPVMVHLCGDLRKIIDELHELHAECLSVDSSTSTAEIADALPFHRIMGGMDSLELSTCTPQEVLTAAEAALAGGVDILAPSCGLDGRVTVENLRAMVRAVHRGAVCAE